MAIQPDRITYRPYGELSNHGSGCVWRCDICGKEYGTLAWIRRHRKSGCCARIANRTHVACSECSVSMRILERGINTAMRTP